MVSDCLGQCLFGVLFSDDDFVGAAVAEEQLIHFIYTRHSERHELYCIVKC